MTIERRLTPMTAGRDNARVTAAAAKMQALGKSLILFTAVLAVGEIVRAKDKVKEAARQGSIIAAGMVGHAATARAAGRRAAEMSAGYALARSNPTR